MYIKRVCGFFPFEKNPVRLCLFVDVCVVCKKMVSCWFSGQNLSILTSQYHFCFQTPATLHFQSKDAIINFQSLDSIAPEGQSPDHRRLARNVGAILDALATIQVQVKDHTGEAYDYGMPLKVVASEPRAGISREVVIETVRPTVIMGENLLQRGEVVIAVPNDEEDIQS